MLSGKGIGNKFVDLHQDNAQAHASIFTQEVLERKGVGFLGILRAVQMSLAVSDAEKALRGLRFATKPEMRTAVQKTFKSVPEK